MRGSDAGVRVPLAAHARLRQVPPRQRHVHHCPGDDDDDDDNIMMIMMIMMCPECEGIPGTELSRRQGDGAAQPAGQR